MRWILLFVCGSLLAFSFNNRSYAENRPGAITITPAIAYYNFSNNRHLDGKGTPNLSLGYNFSDCWGIEGMVALINAENIRAPQNQTVHGYLYMLDGIYRITTFLHYEPYVAFGAGLMDISPTPYSNPEGNLNIGLGSQFFIVKSVALRLEARDIYTPSGGKNDYMINLGLSFLFDTPKWKPCPPAPRKCIPETSCKGEVFYMGEKIG